MKIIYFLLLFVMIACQNTSNNEEAIKLATTDINQLMSQIDEIPLHEIEYQVEIDDKGNAIDTTSKVLLKYYNKDKIAYSHRTRYSDGGERLAEQYFIINGEFIYQKSSSSQSYFSQISIPEIDSTGLVLSLDLYLKDNDKADTISISYDYKFNSKNEREKLIIKPQRDSLDMYMCILYEDDKVVHQYEIANNDTASSSITSYKNGLETQIISEYFSKNKVHMRKEVYFNGDEKMVSNCIYNYPQGKKELTQEFTYKYDTDKRLKSITNHSLKNDTYTTYKVFREIINPIVQN